FLPFSDLVSALQTLGISGINTNSFFRYIIGTATQPNSINQDINGLSGGINVTTNYNDLGIFTPPITPGGATNFPPVAVDDTGTTAEDVAVTFTQADLKGNDTDANNSNAQLSVTAVSNPLNGAVVLNGDGTVTFTPAPDFNGTAGFDYTVSDGSLSDIGHVAITATAVNDALVALNDTDTTDAAAAALHTALPI